MRTDFLLFSNLKAFFVLKNLKFPNFSNDGCVASHLKHL